MHSKTLAPLASTAIASSMLAAALLASQDLAPLAPLRVEPPKLHWRAIDRQAARRAALVIGASSARDPRVALVQAEAAADRLSQVLGLLHYDVSTLAGADVDAGRIRSEIHKLTRDMRGPGNHLIVAWIGHGYARDSVQELAVAESTWIDGSGSPGRLGSPLLYEDLLDWVSQRQREVTDAGGELATVFWIDACRVGTQSLGDASLTWDAELADLQLFSAGPGQEAFIDQRRGLPWFTAELCAALERTFRPAGGQAGKQPVDLRQGFERALESSRELRLQAPQWVGRKELDRFLLYDPAYLALTVRAVNASGEPLAGATITLQDRKKPGPLATFDGLVPSDEGYWLDVRAPGHFGRSQIVELERVASGLALDVPLTRAFVAIEGSVVLENGAGQVLRVGLEGLDASIEPATVIGSGRFRLQAPPSTDACELVVRAGARELFREPLRLSSLTSPRRVDDVEVPVYVRAPLRLSSGAPTAVGAGVSERTVGPISLAFDFGSLSEDDFLTGWRTYDRIRRYAERDEFEAALRQLETLGGDDNVVAEARERYGRLRRELVLSRTLEQVSGLQVYAREQRGADEGRAARETMDAAIELFPEDTRSDPRVRELLESWLLVSAEEWHALGEPERALTALERLEALGHDRDSLAEQRGRVFDDWLARAFDRALDSGDWSTPLSVLESARGTRIASTDLDAWSARIEREAVSPTCRVAFERGKESQADGLHEEARAAYLEALGDAGLNDHYRDTILPLVQRVEDQLFDQYERTAFEKEREDPGAALRAYLKIVDIEPTLEAAIEALLEAHPELARDSAVADYRAHATWRDCVLDTRRALAGGDRVAAWERYSQGVAKAPFRVDGARLLEARILSGASDEERGALMGIRDDARTLQRAGAPAASLEALRDRATYARLDEAEVRGLARAAAQHWPEQFADLELDRVEHFAAGGVAHWMSIWRHGPTGLELVLLPGGTFRMGSPKSEGGDNDETQHEVTLDPFLIARTECTQAAWARVAAKAGLKTDPSYFDGPDELPVEQVSAEEADKWCDAVMLRPPTEAQWEAACRAGTISAYAFGSQAHGLATFGNVYDRDCEYDYSYSREAWSDGHSRTAPAGSYAPNAFGLLDVHGNVWEWCRDFYLGYDQAIEPGTGMRIGTSASRVIRGGGFGSSAWSARSALRYWYGPGGRGRSLGFRPARDLPF